MASLSDQVIDAMSKNPYYRFAKLQEEGIIAKDRNHLIILDMDYLEQL